MARPPVPPHPRTPPLPPRSWPRRILAPVAPVAPSGPAAQLAPPVAAAPTPLIAAPPPAGAGLVRPTAKPVVPDKRTPTPVVLGRFRVIASALLALSAVFGAGAVVQREEELAGAEAASAQVQRLTTVETALTAALDQDLTAPAAAEAFNDRMATVYNALLDAAASGPSDIDSLKSIFAATTAFDNSVNAALAQAQASDAAAAKTYQESSATLDRDARQPLAALIDRVQARAEAGPTVFRVLGLLLATLSAAAVIVVSVVGARRSHRVVNPWWVGSVVLHGGLITQLATMGSASGSMAARLVAVIVTAVVALGFGLAGFRARLREYR